MTHTLPFKYSDFDELGPILGSKREIEIDVARYRSGWAAVKRFHVLGGADEGARFHFFQTGRLKTKTEAIRAAQDLAAQIGAAQ